MSPEICRVVVHRERKPTACTRWKAAVREALRRAFRTPPGSETRACRHRGSLETGESHWFPCRESGVGVPTVEVKTPGTGRRLSPLRRALHEQRTQSKTSDTRYRVRRGRTERTRDGPLAVLADQSTDGREPALLVGKVGNPRPRDPLEGRRSRAARFLAGPMGDTPGSPTVTPLVIY